MRTIYDCGHSARSFDEFTTLLVSHGITLLVDVRSKPYSRWCPWFNRSALAIALPMQYIWLPSLGGLDKSITPDAFEKAIEDLIRYSKRYRTCIFCSELDYKKCHRFTKIQPALEERGIKTIHI